MTIVEATQVAWAVSTTSLPTHPPKLFFIKYYGLEEQNDILCCCCCCCLVVNTKSLFFLWMTSFNLNCENSNWPDKKKKNTWSRWRSFVEVDGLKHQARTARQFLLITQSGRKGIRSPVAPRLLIGNSNDAKFYWRGHILRKKYNKIVIIK